MTVLYCCVYHVNSYGLYTCISAVLQISCSYYFVSLLCKAPWGFTLCQGPMTGQLGFGAQNRFSLWESWPVTLVMWMWVWGRSILFHFFFFISVLAYRPYMGRKCMAACCGPSRCQAEHVAMLQLLRGGPFSHCTFTIPYLVYSLSLSPLTRVSCFFVLFLVMRTCHYYKTIL